MKSYKMCWLIPLLASSFAGAWPLFDGLRTNKLNSEYDKLYLSASYAVDQREKIRLYGEAAGKCSELAELYERNGLTEESAKARFNTGDMLFKQAICTESHYGKFETDSLYGKAVENYSKAAGRYKRLGDMEAYAEAHESAGLALFGKAMTTGDKYEKHTSYERAEIHYELALRQYIQFGNAEKCAELLNLICRALYGQIMIGGKKEYLYTQAEAAYLDAVELYKQFSNAEKHAELLEFTGWGLSVQAENAKYQETKYRLYGEAANNYLKAAEQYKQFDDTEKYAELLGSVGDALYGQAKYADNRETGYRLYGEAANNCLEAAKQCKQLGDAKRYAELVGVAGQALYGQAKEARDKETVYRLYGEAARNYLEAAKQYEQFGDIKKRAKLLDYAGDALYDQAESLLYREENQEKEDRSYSEAKDNYLEAAELYKQLNETEQYVQMIHKVARKLSWQAFSGFVNAEKRACLYGEAAEKFAEVAELYRQIGYPKKAAAALYESSKELENQAVWTRDKAEQARVRDEEKKSYIEATKIYLEIAERYKQQDRLEEYAKLLKELVWVCHSGHKEIRIDLCGELTDRFVELAKLYEQSGKVKERADALSEADFVRKLRSDSIFW